MKRRWIIRSFFIGLLALCVGVWGWSYIYDSNLSYSYAGDEYITGIDDGVITLSEGYYQVSLPEYLHSCDGFNFYGAWKPIDNEWRFYFEPEKSTVRSFIGFSFGRVEFAGHFDSKIGVPLWFMTALAALILFLVWRKTRKPNPATAFPVEMDKTKI